MFMLGRDMKDFLTAGTSIKTAFDPKIHSTQFGPVAPASDLRRGSTSSMDFMESYLTEYRWQEEIKWHEINLQPGGVHSAENVQKFWDIKKKRDKDFVLDPVIKMSQALTATPTAEMFDDSGTGVAPIKSLWAMLNLWEKRHYDSSVPEGAENLFPNMTNQQGLNPDDPRFARVDSYGKSYTNGGSQLAPTKVSYGTSADYVPGTANGHLFSRMKFWLNRLSWKPVPMADSHAGAMEVAPSTIMCTDDAIMQYDNAARGHGDLYATIAPVGDPAQSLTKFNGIPLMACDDLREAEIYPDVTTGGGVGDAADNFIANGNKGLTERDANALRGGRFYAIDPRTINIWFHRARQWSESEWYTLMPLNPDIMARYGQFLGGTHAESFVQNGILFPSADQGAQFGVGN